MGLIDRGNIGPEKTGESRSIKIPEGSHPLLSNINKFQIIKEDRVIFYDCDNCLVLWPEDSGYNPDNFIQIASSVSLLSGESTYKLTPNKGVIEDLKKKKEESYYIVVWSQGGFEHARRIVEGLELQEFVDIVMSKPLWIVDDLDPKEVFSWRHPKELYKY